MIGSAASAHSRQARAPLQVRRAYSLWGKSLIVAVSLVASMAGTSTISPGPNSMR